MEIESEIESCEWNEVCYSALMEMKQKYPMLRERIESIVRQWTILSDIDKKVIFFYFFFKENDGIPKAKELTQTHRLGSVSSKQFVERAQRLCASHESPYE